MNPQLRGHFRGRFAAVEPALNSLLFESFVKLFAGDLGLDHRCIHSCFAFQCLSLPVSAKPRRPKPSGTKEENSTIKCLIRRLVDNLGQLLAPIVAGMAGNPLPEVEVKTRFWRDFSN
jgi:hypothetical protein